MKIESKEIPNNIEIHQHKVDITDCKPTDRVFVDFIGPDGFKKQLMFSVSTNNTLEMKVDGLGKLEALNGYMAIIK